MKLYNFSLASKWNQSFINIIAKLIISCVNYYYCFFPAYCIRIFSLLNVLLKYNFSTNLNPLYPVNNNILCKLEVSYLWMTVPIYFFSTGGFVWCYKLVKSGTPVQWRSDVNLVMLWLPLSKITSFFHLAIIRCGQLLFHLNCCNPI